MRAARLHYFAHAYMPLHCAVHLNQILHMHMVNRMCQYCPRKVYVNILVCSVGHMYVTYLRSAMLALLHTYSYV